MKTFIRVLSLLLVVIMLSSCFMACNNTGDEKESEKQTDPKTDVTPGTTDGEVAALPNMNLNGEIYNILGYDNPDYVHLDNFEIAYDELPEDVVGQEVYNRNQALKSKYNFIVTQTLTDNPAETAKISYESGDDLYDLVLYKPNTVQAHAQEGYLLDLNELEYVNLDHDCWSQYINDQLTIGDKLYYTTNDFVLIDKARAFYLFYNRELAEDLKLGYLEDMVDNNTWTLENATKLSKQTSRDVDNNGYSSADYFGFASEGASQFIHIALSAGFRFTEKDNDGFPKLVGATDKMLNIIDAALDFTADKNIAWCQQTMGQLGVEADHPEIMFLDGRVLLLHMTTFFIEYNYKLRNSTIEIGILPHPKYEASQDVYSSSADNYLGAVLAVPYTVFDEDVAGFCLEAISEASTDTTYTTFIDTKCKYQDAPDKDCARMMDLCFENQVYDVGCFLFNGNDELYTRTAYDLQKNGVNLYKRLFDTYKKSAQAEIDALVDAYK